MAGSAAAVGVPSACHHGLLGLSGLVIPTSEIFAWPNCICHAVDDGATATGGFSFHDRQATIPPARRIRMKIAAMIAALIFVVAMRIIAPLARAAACVEEDVVFPTVAANPLGACRVASV